MANDEKWEPIFDNAKEKGKTSNADDKTNKRLSVERIYQKKSQLEHILLRPDTYIGSVEFSTTNMYVMDEEETKMVQKEISYVPGLYKIFDEILVNAADNKQRDPKMNTIKIDIDPEHNKIKIWNNGKGIPVVEHKTEKMYVPTMIFGHLLTSSNYDDSEKKVTGGRNGYGAKLCNIFSTKFIVETSCGEYKRAFKQTWTNNMLKASEPILTESRADDFTAITFWPDLPKFGMTSLDKDIVALFTRRAYDIAASTRGVRVMLNGKKVPVKNFKDYVDLHIKDKVDDAGQPLKVVYEQVSERWEVAVTISDQGFQQASFVNSIATTKGGRHVDHVADPLVNKIIEIVKKKNKGGLNIKPFQIKSHMWLFVNCLIENPSFDSQTKENMTLQQKGFGSKCVPSEKFITAVSKCGIVESVMSWMKFKEQAQLQKKCHSSKHSKLKGIPKLDDANFAGTKNSQSCTLILTEGDSAKSLAVAGLAIVGRDCYGVFPLKGKVLNVREATHKQIMENAEINNLVKIMGLQFKEKYEDIEKIRSLRYGKIMIMTDQDNDGSHIKGLLINFIHHFWPSLLKHNLVEEFITPIVKVTKNKQEKSFYSIPEFEEWQRNTEQWHTWKVKYYKGLGTSTAKEAKEYFADMQRHRIPFKYEGPEDDASINLAFSKKKVDERKEWLTNWMEEKKRRTEMGLPELYLYGKGTTQVTFNEFINRELILFSYMDNNRSIPSLVDGLKPGQRKVIFTCFKRNDKKEIKVAQLAGSVAELSAYHHGEMSLMSTIINLAQNFVGSNNINLLQPIGQFGTRIHGGKDAASPRYIFTNLSPLAKLIFNPNDLPLLKDLYDDNQKIEPEYYVPIIPMILVNGSEGIGTGWSTKIPNYDPREIVANIKRLLDGNEPLLMVPWFKNFRGTIEELSDHKCSVSGEISILDDNTVEISELPIRTWTQNYKEEILEPMVHGSEKVAAVISDYKEYHTDATVRFIVKMSAEKLAAAELTGLHKFFKLQTTFSTNCMVLFDHNGCIRKYEKVEQILREFFDLRLDFYKRRKDYMEGLLHAESLKLDNIARFIMEKIDGVIKIENVAKKDIIQMLVRRGYDSDPAKSWKEAQNKSKDKSDSDDDGDEEDKEKSGPDFNYILNLSLWCLTKEKKEDYMRQRDNKADELDKLRRKRPEDLYRDDLETFLVELDRVEEQEREDAKAGIVQLQKTQKGRGVKNKKMNLEETLPSHMGRRIVPVIDLATKVKAEKEASSKKRQQIKKEMTEENGDAPSSEAKPKKPRQPRAPRQSTGSPKGKKAKGGKKKKPWESDDSDLGSISSLSDHEMGGGGGGGGDSSVNVARERIPRRAAAQAVKYNFGDDEDEDEYLPVIPNEQPSSPFDDEEFSEMAGENDEKENEDDSFSSPNNKKEKKPNPAPARVASPIPSDDTSDDEKTDLFSRISEQNKKARDDAVFGVSSTKLPKTTLPTKEPTKSTAVTFDLSSDDEKEPPFISEEPPKKQVKKRAPKKEKAEKAEKPPKKRKVTKKKEPKNSDSEDGFEPKKPKVKALKRTVDTETDDDEFMDGKEHKLNNLQARTTTGRSRAPVKYFEDESDEDFEF